MQVSLYCQDLVWNGRELRRMDGDSDKKRTMRKVY